MAKSNKHGALNVSNADEARAEQARLATQVRLTPSQKMPPLVCGVDVSYATDDSPAAAAAVIIDTKTFEVVEKSLVTGHPEFPYVPGLLSFRELPLALDAIAKLSTVPELAVVDGHGYAHPQRFGLASHLGVMIDRPAIGCAKTSFVGVHTEPGENRGEWTPITDATTGELLGTVLRTRTGVKPVFVSPGHLIDVTSAREIVLGLCPRFRLPETTRAADQLSRQALAARSLGL